MQIVRTTGTNLSNELVRVEFGPLSVIVLPAGLSTSPDHSQSLIRRRYVVMVTLTDSLDAAPFWTTTVYGPISTEGRGDREDDRLASVAACVIDNLYAAHTDPRRFLDMAIDGVRPELLLGRVQHTQQIMNVAAARFRLIEAAYDAVPEDIRGAGIVVV